MEDMIAKYRELAERMGVLEEAKQAQILATGFKAVEISSDNFVREMQKFSVEKESEIQKRWNEQKRKIGKNLWNDPTASVVNFSIDVFGRLELVLRRSDYKTYVGTREKRFVNTNLIPMDENCSLPLSMGAVTITSDDFIFLGLRDKTEARRNELGLAPSGYLDPSVHFLKTELGEIISVEELMLCELFEELKIQTYTKKAYLALIQDMQPMIAVRLEIPFTKKEMERIAEINFEHSKFIYVENTIDGIKKAFKKYEFTTHALSAILCHLL